MFEHTCKYVYSFDSYNYNDSSYTFTQTRYGIFKK